MSYGQTMLAILFLVLLTLAVINGNRLIVDKEESFYKNQAYQEASFLANNLLTEIVSKKYDQNVHRFVYNYITIDGIGVKHYDSITNDSIIGIKQDSSCFSSTMGSETNYSYWWHPSEWSLVSNRFDSLIDGNTTRPFHSQDSTNFNDVDDYNGYCRNVAIRSNGRITQSLTQYTLFVKVYYVQRGSEDVESVSKSYLKRIDVTVTDSKAYLTKPLKFSTIKAFAL